MAFSLAGAIERGPNVKLSEATSLASRISQLMRDCSALGPLLCGLGQALQPLVGGVTAAVRGLVTAINAVLI
jgi:hypothetical protein